MEQWLDVVDYEGMYQVSNYGNVKSFKLKEPVIMKGKTDNQGYHRVEFRKNGESKTHAVHRLVATAFIPQPIGKDVTHHKDGVKKNNHVNNLEWTTQSANVQHAYDTGLKAKGELHCMAKLTNEQVKEARASYVPHKIGFGIGALAKKYGVGHTSMFNILHGKSYKGV